jgi:Holliday junction resolvasome RuvABC endonuclease subunit
MKVLAFDLSLSATGIAMPNGALSTFRSKAEGDARLTDIAGWCRMAAIQSGSDLVPDLVVIEDVPRNPYVATVKLAMLHGAVRYVLRIEGHRYLTVPPATLKTYATGKGTAQKADMRMELYKRTGLDVDDDNQCDAAWLRYLGLDLCGHPEIELPAKHRRALDKLTLPVGAVVLS